MTPCNMLRIRSKMKLVGSLMRLRLASIVFTFAIIFSANSAISDAIHVALHAQVLPSESKIVGSVITTDGLRAAFEVRPEVETCTTFYPFSYEKFHIQKWDVVVIEGWFRNIHDFIHMVRTHSESAIILFYCLDPSFPGLDSVHKFDVDGFITNSRVLANDLENIVPTIYIMLAADPIIMRRNTSITREWGAVYVGAGGRMLIYKQNLLPMLIAAKSYGLKIYGSNWEVVDEVNDNWHGILPHGELANAYSSAHVVLASTIDTQATFGMVNNRIFEALSCGAIVLSDYSEALFELAGDLVLFSNTTTDVATNMDFIISNPNIAEKTSQRSRNFILGSHTWSHRVVEVLDFFWDIKYKSASSSINFEGSGFNGHKHKHATSEGQHRVNFLPARHHRLNRPKLLCVVSSVLVTHPDYQTVIRHNMLSSTDNSGLDKHYKISLESESKWLEIVENCTSSQNLSTNKVVDWSSHCLSWLSMFDVILAVATPFDRVDASMRSLPTVTLQRTQQPQKRALYMIGFDGRLAVQAVHELPSGYIDIDPLISNSTRSTADAASNSTTTVDAASLSQSNVAWMSRRRQELRNSFRQYDTIWYRDTHELHLLMDTNLVSVNSLRLQHAFGIDCEDGIAIFSGPIEGDVGATRSSSVTPDRASNINEERLAGAHTNSHSAAREGEFDGVALDGYVHGYILIVCFAHAKEMCKLGVQKNIIAHSLLNDDSTATEDDRSIQLLPPTHRLLLLGGTWAEWLEDHDLIRYNYLHLVTHVAHERRGPAATLIARAQELIYCHEGNRHMPLNIPGIVSSDGVEERQRASAMKPSSAPMSSVDRTRAAGDGDVDGEGEGEGGIEVAAAVAQMLTDTDGNPLQSFTAYTVGDVLWPLVAALTADRVIQLIVSNTHILSVVDEGCQRWTSAYMTETVNKGLVRVHGLASARSSVTARLISPPSSSSADAGPSPPCASLNSANSICASENTDLQTSATSVTPIEIDNSSQPVPHFAIDGVCPTFPCLMTAVVEAEFEEFQAGTDGEFCIRNVVEQQHEELLLCLITPVQRLVIEITLPDRSALKWRSRDPHHRGDDRSNIDTSEQAGSTTSSYHIATLRFVLKSVMYLDEIFSTTLSIDTALTPSWHWRPEHVDQMMMTTDQTFRVSVKKS